jgi:hypothetical protein
LSTGIRTSRFSCSCRFWSRTTRTTSTATPRRSAAALDAGHWVPPDLVALRGTSPQHLPGYYGMVRRLDEAFGRLMDALISLGLLDNTIVLFTSDHGCHFKTRNAEYKRSCHESSVRVPTMITGPGFIGGGEVRALFSTIDIAPTLLDAAGLAVPAVMQGPLDPAGRARQIRAVARRPSSSCRNRRPGAPCARSAGNIPSPRPTTMTGRTRNPTSRMPLRSRQRPLRTVQSRRHGAVPRRGRRSEGPIAYGEISTHRGRDARRSPTRRRANTLQLMPDKGAGVSAAHRLAIDPYKSPLLDVTQEFAKGEPNRA